MMRMTSPESVEGAGPSRVLLWRMADVTSGQRNLLDFFGRTARTKAEAHKVIDELLSQPGNAQRWLIERARRCVAKMDPAISGSGGHNATFAVACVLVHGFALSVAEAMPLMQEYNQRCDPAWSEQELEYKLRSAERSAHDTPRGHMRGDEVGPRPAAPVGSQAAPALTKPKVLFDPEKLAERAQPWNARVNLPWLANRSAVDPATVTPERFLHMLYAAGEKVLCFTNQKTQGQALWPAEKVPTGSAEGVWFLPQPVDGESHINPRMPPGADRKPRWSRRSEESVTAFRYMVFESDQADARDWLGLLVQMPFRVEAIYTSGGRSVHVLIRVDCRTKREWDDYKESITPAINLMCLGGLDPKVITAVRLTRLPGCWRGDKLQKLLYVRPNAPVQKLIDLPVVRDVEEAWCRQAGYGVSDEDDGRGAVTIRHALAYYGPASRRCRDALVSFTAAMQAAGFDVGK